MNIKLMTITLCPRLSNNSLAKKLLTYTNLEIHLQNQIQLKTLIHPMLILNPHLTSKNS